MANAYAYVRYSSAMQSHGDSVDRQLTPLTRFTDATGISISETFIDEGISSFKGDNIRHGRFRDLLDKVEQGDIKQGDYIVIESIDRISRQELNKTSAVLYSILEKGISIYTTVDERTYSLADQSRDLENYLMIGLIAKRANEESEMKSRRRKSAWRKAKVLAKNENVIFNSSNNTPYGLKVVNGSFEIVEDEAEEIRAIFELLKYQGVSNSIKKVNINSKRKWVPRHVHQMIVNKYVIGVYRAQRRENGKKVFEENIENYYPEIVSAKLFYEAIDAMKSRATKTYYGNESTGSLNIFKHCVKCQCCGASMRFYRGKNSKGDQFAYIACMRKKESGFGCYEQAFRFDYAIGTLLRYLRALCYQYQEGISYSADDVNPMACEYSTSFKQADNLFVEMMTAPKNNMEGIENKQIELAKAKSTLLNYNESISGLDGKIPSTIMQSIIEIENKIDVLNEELREIEFEAESLNVVRFEQFLELLFTENGRQRINRFFKTNGYSFSFEYKKDIRSVMMKVVREGVVVGAITEKFKLRTPLLDDFGIKNFNDLHST